jgi:hypothetical protein
MSNEKFEYYSASLSLWINYVIKTQNPKDIKAICSLWNDESWESIVRKFQTEGSVWVVWWTDGVIEYAKLDITAMTILKSKTKS